MFGNWIKKDVAEDMWVSIPAGLNYTGVSEVTLSSDGTRIVKTYIMKTEDGQIISVGSSMAFLADKANTIMLSHSGFDMGKPCNGNSVVKDMKNKSISRMCTEHSQGETTEYIQHRRMIDANTQENTVQRSDRSGAVGSGISRRIR
jgi:hypothetical protein